MFTGLSLSQSWLYVSTLTEEATLQKDGDGTSSKTLGIGCSVDAKEHNSPGFA